MNKQRSMAELEAALPHLQAAPADEGVVQMVVARPTVNERTLLSSGQFSIRNGLEGDSWRSRGSKRTADGSAHPEMQVTLMNGRFLDLIAGEKERWPLAGDQLIVDMDLSESNLPPGQRLQIGTAVFEVTPMPHTGCRKFSDRFGKDAVKFANNAHGKQLRLRGMYVQVVVAGEVQVGDCIQKIVSE